ncbi:hypothetical protein X740_27880 [Mesorhizobium sp. LNHC221B00]|nr:hypothetical protein X740_27880 [Mesorhizobium sp. LNHC221B00]
MFRQRFFPSGSYLSGTACILDQSQNPAERLTVGLFKKGDRGARRRIENRRHIAVQGDYAFFHRGRAHGCQRGVVPGFKDELGCRSDGNRVTRPFAELTDWIIGLEFANAAVRADDDANGAIRASGKDIHHIAPKSDLTRFINPFVDNIANCFGSHSETVPVELLSHLQNRETASNDRSRRHPLQAGFDRHYSDARAIGLCCDLTQRAKSPPHIGACRPHPVVRQAIPGRQEDDVRAGEELMQSPGDLLGDVFRGSYMDDVLVGTGLKPAGQRCRHCRRWRDDALCREAVIIRVTDLSDIRPRNMPVH